MGEEGTPGPSGRWWKWVKGRKYYEPSTNTFDNPATVRTGYWL